MCFFREGNYFSYLSILRDLSKKRLTCLLESKDYGDCGHFSGVSAPISFLECQDDVSSHLKYYRLSSKRVRFDFALFRSFWPRNEKVKHAVAGVL